MLAEREIYPLNKKEQYLTDLVKSGLSYFKTADRHQPTRNRSRIEKFIAFSYLAPLLVLMSAYQSRNYCSEVFTMAFPKPLTEEEELCLLEKLDTRKKNRLNLLL